MEERLKTILIASPEEINEAYRELSAKIEHVAFESFSDIPNFEYLLKHRSAADSDVYLFSRPYIELSIAQDRDGKIRSQDALSLRLLTETATRWRDVKPFMLNYDLFPTIPNRYGSDGGIKAIPAKEKGRIYTPSFYASLAELLNNSKFRRGIVTRNPSTLGDVEADSHSILTFNPATINTTQTPLI
jgi:hypothetical protein